jgi:transcriptional regulator with XRE-family HTH domain
MNMQAAHTNSLGTSAVQRLRLTLAMAEHVERIGARIRARREELGLSRRALAKKMAGIVTENDIYRWERGQHKPGDDKLEALGLALEVDVSYFMLPEPQAGAPDLMASLNSESQLDRIEEKLDIIIAELHGQDGVADTVSRLVNDLAAAGVLAEDDQSHADSSGRSGAKAAARKPRARGTRKGGQRPA